MPRFWEYENRDRYQERKEAEEKPDLPLPPMARTSSLPSWASSLLNNGGARSWLPTQGQAQQQSPFGQTGRTTRAPFGVAPDQAGDEGLSLPSLNLDPEQSSLIARAALGRLGRSGQGTSQDTSQQFVNPQAPWQLDPGAEIASRMGAVNDVLTPQVQQGMAERAYQRSPIGRAQGFVQRLIPNLTDEEVDRISQRTGGLVNLPYGITNAELFSAPYRAAGNAIAGVIGTGARAVTELGAAAQGAINGPAGRPDSYAAQIDQQNSEIAEVFGQSASLPYEDRSAEEQWKANVAVGHQVMDNVILPVVDVLWQRGVRPTVGILWGVGTGQISAERGLQLKMHSSPTMVTKMAQLAKLAEITGVTDRAREARAQRYRGEAPTTDDITKLYLEIDGLVGLNDDASLQATWQDYQNAVHEAWRLEETAPGILQMAWSIALDPANYLGPLGAAGKLGKASKYAEAIDNVQNAAFRLNILMSDNPTEAIAMAGLQMGARYGLDWLFKQGLQQISHSMPQTDNDVVRSLYEAAYLDTVSARMAGEDAEFDTYRRMVLVADENASNADIARNTAEQIYNNTVRSGSQTIRPMTVYERRVIDTAETLWRAQHDPAVRQAMDSVSEALDDARWSLGRNWESVSDEARAYWQDLGWGQERGEINLGGRGEEGEEPGAERAAGEPETPQRIFRGDRIQTADGRHGTVTNVIHHTVGDAWGNARESYDTYHVRYDDGVEDSVRSTDGPTLETEVPEGAKIPIERPTVDQRVQLADGRHGTITKADSLHFESPFGGVPSHSSWVIYVRTDDGVESSQQRSDVYPETEPAPQVTEAPRAVLSSRPGQHEPAESLYDSLARYHNKIIAAYGTKNRARKPESRARAQNEANGAFSIRSQILREWNRWKQVNPAEAKRIEDAAGYNTAVLLKDYGSVDHFVAMSPIRAHQGSVATQVATTQAATQPAQSGPTAYTLTERSAQGGVEVKFPGVPSGDVLSFLKANGFKWAKGNKVWYARPGSEAHRQQLVSAVRGRLGGGAQQPATRASDAETEALRIQNEALRGREPTGPDDPLGIAWQSLDVPRSVTSNLDYWDESEKDVVRKLYQHRLLRDMLQAEIRKIEAIPKSERTGFDEERRIALSNKMAELYRVINGLEPALSVYQARADKSRATAESTRAVETPARPQYNEGATQEVQGASTRESTAVSGGPGPRAGGVVEEVPSNAVQGGAGGGQPGAVGARAGQGYGGVRPVSEGVGRGPTAGVESGKAPTPVSDRPVVESEPPRFVSRSTPGAGRDYIITARDDIGNASVKTLLRANMDALRLLKKLDAEQRLATPEEQAALVKYTGWGNTGFNAAFGDRYTPTEWEKARASRAGLLDEYLELRNLLTQDEFEEMAHSRVNAHYTSPDVIREVWSAVERMGFGGLGAVRVLEPSVGVGHFFGLEPSALASISQRTGIDLDITTAKIAAQLYQGAQIIHSGFETAPIPKDYYDLAISNVPFGEYSIVVPEWVASKDNKWKSGGNTLIHNQFFMKALEHVRPGGVVAFVTSKGTMDAGNAGRVRAAISDVADLLGAVRLPQTAFKDIAGTSVTTDIIFLRKRYPDERRGGQAWQTTKAISLRKPSDAKKSSNYQLNSYYHEHPEMVLGTHALERGSKAAEQYTLLPKGDTALATQLRKALENLPANIVRDYEAPRSQQDVEAGFIDAKGNPDVSIESKVNAYSLGSDGRTVFIMGQDGKKVAATFRSDRDEDRVRQMVNLGDAAREVYAAQRAGDDAGWERARAKLNRLYDGFVQQYGPLNRRYTRQLMSRDPRSYALLALEKWDADTEAQYKSVTEMSAGEVGALKAPVFSRKTISVPEVPDRVDNARDALSLSLASIGRLDLPHIARLYGGSVENAREELRGLVFEDPGAGFVTADEYLSGDVRTKLAQARAAANEDAKYDENVTALEAVQPKDLGPSEINLQLGAPWLPSDYVADFIVDTFKLGEHYWAVEDAYNHYRKEVSFVQALASWNVPKLGGVADRLDLTANYGTEAYPADELIDALLNNRQIRVTKEVVDAEGNKQQVFDAEETAKATAQSERILQAFERWAWGDPERAARIAGIYNEKVNRYVPREYNGEHLMLPGTTPGIQLMPHQKNAIWRIIASGNTLLAHEVGAGKSYEMIGAGMEMRRLGLSRKNLYVVPNPLVAQFADEFMRLYPGATILVPGQGDFGSDRRRLTMARIQSGDWDAVIVPQSQFTLLQADPATRYKVIREQLDQLHEALTALDEIEDKTQKRMSQKAVEQAISKLESKLKTAELEIANRQDDSIYWEDLGVTALFVDESDMFKNLGITTRFSRIKGLSTTQSQRAFDMYIKVREITERMNGRGVIFATGTPIANTFAELWTTMRYLAQPLLKEQGLMHFDNFAKTFAKSQVVQEMKANGQYQDTTRFTNWVNAPELSRIWQLYTDIVLSGDVPALEAKKPKLVGGMRTEIITPFSDWMMEFMQSLTPRMDWVQAHAGDSDAMSEDNNLKIYGDARKAAIDPRLIDPSLPIDPESKIVKLADNLYRHWLEDTDDRGTQLVFLDIGTPKSESEKQDTKNAAADKAAGKVSSDDEGEDDALVQLEEEVADDDTLAEEVAQRTTLYGDIRQLLVERGIPEGEIAFIHEYKTQAARKALFQAMNRGDTRVLIGSTSKMGAGMNVQRRLHALHHIDVPWRPRDIEQREGRILRQGNEVYGPKFDENGEVTDPGRGVHVYAYISEGSFDAISWQILENKLGLVHAIVRKNVTERSVEEVDDDANDYARKRAVSTGNPLVLVHVRREAELRKLMAEMAQYLDRRVAAQRAIDRAQHLIEVLPRDIEEISADIAHVKSVDTSKVSYELGGKTYTSRDEANAALVALVEDAMVDPHAKAWRAGSGDERYIAAGKLFGFDVRLMVGVRNGLRPVLISMNGKRQYGAFGAANLISGPFDKVNFVTRLVNIVNSLPGDLRKAEGQLAAANRDLAEARRILAEGESPLQRKVDRKQRELDLIGKAMIAGEKTMPDLSAVDAEFGPEREEGTDERPDAAVEPVAEEQPEAEVEPVTEEVPEASAAQAIQAEPATPEPVEEEAAPLVAAPEAPDAVQEPAQFPEAEQGRRVEADFGKSGVGATLQDRLRSMESSGKAKSSYTSNASPYIWQDAKGVGQAEGNGYAFRWHENDWLVTQDGNKVTIERITGQAIEGQAAQPPAEVAPVEPDAAGKTPLPEPTKEQVAQAGGEQAAEAAVVTPRNLEADLAAARKKNIGVRDLGSLHLGELNGKPIWTDSYVLEVGPLPTRWAKYAEGNTSQPVSEARIKEIIPDSIPEASKAVGVVDSGLGDPYVALVTGDRQGFVFIKSMYYGYFARQKGATFHALSDSKPVVIMRDGEFHGLVMPLRASSYVDWARQIRERYGIQLPYNGEAYQEGVGAVPAEPSQAEVVEPESPAPTAQSYPPRSTELPREPDETAVEELPEEEPEPEPPTRWVEDEDQENAFWSIMQQLGVSSDDVLKYLGVGELSEWNGAQDVALERIYEHMTPPTAEERLDPAQPSAPANDLDALPEHAGGTIPDEQYDDLVKPPEVPAEPPTKAPRARRAPKNKPVAEWTPPNVDFVEQAYDRFVRLKYLSDLTDIPAYSLSRITGDAGSIGAAKVKRYVMPVIHSVGRDIDWLEQYMIAQRGIDAIALFGDEYTMPGGKTPEQLLSEVENEVGPERWDKIEQAAESLWQLTDELMMKPSLEAGRISQKTYDFYTSRWPHYLPFMREGEDAETFDGMLNEGARVIMDRVSPTGQFTQKLNEYGSTKALKQPLQQWINMVISRTAANTRNVAMDAMLSGLEKAQKMTGAPLIQWRVKHPIQGWGLVEVWRKGRRMTAMVPTPYALVAKDIRPDAVSGLLYALQTAAWPLRQGATKYNPGFILKNALRDPTTALLTTGMVPFGPDYWRGWANVIGKTDAYWDALERGELQTGMTATLRGGTSAERGREARGIPLDSPGDVLLSVFRLTALANEKVEQATRMGAILHLDRIEANNKGVQERIAKELGKHANDPRWVELAASVRRREVTLDFSKFGRLGGQISMIQPFFASNVQAAAVLPKVAKEDPKRLLLTLLPMGLATIAMYFINRRWDTFDDIPGYEYTNNWVFQVGEGVRNPDPRNPDAEPERFPIYFTVPKGQWVTMATLPIEAMLRAATGQNDYSALEVIAGVLGAASPITNPASSLFLPGLGTIAQVLLNKDAFTGEDIVPEWEAHRPPEERYDQNNSATAIAMGDLFNISPRIIDFALRDMLGGVVDGVLPISDLVLRALGYDPQAAGYALEQQKTLWEKADRWPIIGAFVGTRSTSEAIKARKTMNKEIRTAQRLLYQNEEVRALNLGVSAPATSWIGSNGMAIELTAEQRQWYVREWSTQFKQMADILAGQEWYTSLDPLSRRQTMETARRKIQDNARSAVMASIEGGEFDGWSARSIPYLATALQQHQEFSALPQYTDAVTPEDILAAQEANSRYATMRNRGQVANWAEYMMKTGDSEGYVLIKRLERSKNPERSLYWEQHPELRFFFPSEKPGDPVTSVPGLPRFSLP